MTVITKSGQRGYALAKMAAGKDAIRTGELNGVEKSPQLADGESGSVLEVEPVLGADSLHIDLNWNFLHRDGLGKSARQLESVSSLALRHNASALVALWPKELKLNSIPKDKVESLALILHVDLLDPSGVPARQTLLKQLRKAGAAGPATK